MARNGMRIRSVAEGDEEGQRRELYRAIRRLHDQAAVLAEQTVAQAWEPQSIELAHELMDELERFMWVADVLRNGGYGQLKAF